MPADGSSPADRRTQQGLVFDPESRWLSIGRFVQEIDPGGGNRAVLNAYVELTARCRHDRIANVVHVRDSDVRALADALDLKADDLASEIESVLALSRAEALKTIGRMRSRASSAGWRRRPPGRSSRAASSPAGSPRRAPSPTSPAPPPPGRSPRRRPASPRPPRWPMPCARRRRRRPSSTGPSPRRPTASGSSPR
ncbi:MAG: hypothetical protein R2711_11515 [Acidimicrobiales bacterium]